MRAALLVVLMGCGAAAAPAKPKVCAPPPIAPPAPKVMGFCPKDGVVQRVQRGAADVRTCYTAALERGAPLPAKVTLVWTVDTQGVPTILGVKAGKSSDHCLTECVSAAVARWRFPPSPGGVCRVTFPFAFTRGCDNPP